MFTLTYSSCDWTKWKATANKRQEDIFVADSQHIWHSALVWFHCSFENVLHCLRWIIGWKSKMWIWGPRRWIHTVWGFLGPLTQVVWANRVSSVILQNTQVTLIDEGARRLCPWYINRVNKYVKLCIITSHETCVCNFINFLASVESMQCMLFVGSSLLLVVVRRIITDQHWDVPAIFTIFDLIEVDVSCGVCRTVTHYFYLCSGVTDVSNWCERILNILSNVIHY